MGEYRGLDIDGADIRAEKLDVSWSSDDMYRFSKFQQENLVKQWCITHNVDYCGLLPSAIYTAEARKDTNIGRLQALLQFLPVLPRISVPKSLTNLHSFCNIIHAHIVNVGCEMNIRHEEYLTIDLPVQTVTDIMLSNSARKKFIINVVGLRALLIFFHR